MDYIGAVWSCTDKSVNCCFNLWKTLKLKNQDGYLLGNYKKYIFYDFFDFYWKGSFTERKRDKEKDLPFTCSLTKWPKQSQLN